MPLRASCGNEALGGSKATTLATVTLAAASLSARRGSRTFDKTSALAVRIVASGVEQLKVVVRVMVAVASTASDEKLTTRSLPVPAHTPPPVDEQEAFERSGGNAIRATAPSALTGPWLTTVKTRLRTDPASRVAGAETVSDRSATGSGWIRTCRFKRLSSAKA
jgi:hypothetical protein